jgi:hypothetical protein
MRWCSAMGCNPTASQGGVFVAGKLVVAGVVAGDV